MGQPNSLLVILLSMAIGLVVGYEIGQNSMRKRMMLIIHNIAEQMKKTAEAQQKEREKNLENLSKKAEELKEQWTSIFNKSYSKSHDPADKIRGDFDGDSLLHQKLVGTPDILEKIKEVSKKYEKKEQKENESVKDNETSN